MKKSTWELVAIIGGDANENAIAGLRIMPICGKSFVLKETPALAITLPMSRRERLQRIVMHQRYLEQAMAFGDVLPVQHGQFVDLADLTNIAIANEAFLDRLFKDYSNLVQFQITVEWDRSKALQAFKTSDELRDLFNGQPVSADALRTSVTNLCIRLSHDMANELAAATDHTVSLPRSEDMLLNSVCLMNRDKTDILDAAVTRIDAIWSEGLRIRQLGPAPASSFVNLALQKVEKTEILKAERLFGQQTIACEATVVTARKQLLRQNTGLSLSEIDRSTDILRAKLRLGDNVDALYLLHQNQEGLAEPAALVRKIA